jgi:ribosome-associated translation inhibitor RaiA
MKLAVQHHHLRSSDELDSLIENRILALQARIQIDEAHVRLECRFEESPAFSVRVHLVTAGPDVFAERRDHTIRAAIEKVMADVEAKIGSRFEKRRWRIRSNIQEPALRRMGPARR